MPPRSLAWNQLAPGLVTIGVIAMTAVSVLAFARVGSLRGDTYRIYLLADEARGVIAGTEVWIAGTKAGVVRGVSFRPVTADTLGRLAVELEVLRRVQPQIRRDSRVEFRAGGTAIGATIVAIGVGSPQAPMLAPGDTLPRAPQIDPDSVRVALSAATRQLPALLNDVRDLGAGLARALGPRPHANRDDSAPLPALNRLATRAAQLARRLETARGTLPLLLRDSSLAGPATRIVAGTDSVLRSANAEHGTVARLHRDPTLLRALSELRVQLATLRRALDSSAGTAGRLAHDSAIAHQLHRLRERRSPP